MKFEIPIDAIDTFRTWNAEPLKQNRSCDKLMVEALILILVTPDDITKGLVNDEVREFIHGFLEIRIGDDADRLSKVDKYIEEACNGRKN